MGNVLKWILAPSAIIGIIGWFIASGSGVKIAFQDTDVASEEIQYVVVCVDKQGVHDFTDTAIQPIVYNPGWLSTYDLSIRYNVEQHGLVVTPMVDEKLKSKNSSDPNAIVLEYDKGTLYKHRDAGFAIKEIAIKQDDSRLAISVDAVYKTLFSRGRKCRFDYMFIVVPRGKSDLQQWKYDCVKALGKKQLPASFHFVMMSNSVSYEGVRNANTLNEAWTSFKAEPMSEKKAAERMEDKRDKPMRVDGISQSEAQRIFDMVSNGKMTEGQALAALSKGKVSLASTTDGMQTLIEVLHEMEMGATTDDPVFYNIVSFQNDPNTGKIKSGTLIIEKRI